MSLCGDNDPLRKGSHSKTQLELQADPLALPVRRVGDGSRGHLQMSLCLIGVIVSCVAS